MTPPQRIFALCLLFGLSCAPARGQDAANAAAEKSKQEATGTVGTADAADLAKQLANPVASLISVPIQSNLDFGIGPNDAYRSTTNIQPVVPISISEDWNVISRTILPVIYAEAPANGLDDEFGLGDIVQSLFFSPKESNPIWGVGPAFLIPTATNDVFASDKFGIGPTAVVLKQKGPWTIGFLGNHLWSVAGGGDADVNSTFLQPFLSYTTSDAWTFTINSESTYNWDAEQWSAPVNAVVSKLVSFGSQKASVFAGARYYMESPDGGPDWGARFGLTFLFPK